MQNAMSLRPDGRRADELRPVTIVYEGLDRSDGSARFAFGPTQSLASVSGPIEPRPQTEHPSLSTLEVHVRPLSSIPSTQSRALASTLRSILSPSIILTQNPRSLIQLVIQSLSAAASRSAPWGTGGGRADGDMDKVQLAGMVNSSTLALINAGSIPMRGVVCAVAVSRLTLPPTSSSSTSTSMLVLDPSESELGSLTASGIFAFLFSVSLSPLSSSGAEETPSELIWSSWQSALARHPDGDKHDWGGDANAEELSRARDIAREGAREVWRAMRQSLPAMEGRTEVSRLGVKEKKTDGNIGAGVEQREDDDKMEI